MIKPVPISDEDLNDVLLKAGFTPEEIETQPEARQIAKLALGAVTAIVLDRLAQQIIAEVSQ